MNDLSWAATMRFVHERGRYTCEYCQTSQLVIGQAMHVEHINPDGGDGLENLCLSCSSCNLSKGTAILARDELTATLVPLFNPRQQEWSEHFSWAGGATRVEGKTEIGRATVVALQLNRPSLVLARRLWRIAGWHPPKM
ncbi:HNH endonuclease [bacterium]|nr:HNH endonuclease [bacterium]